MSSKSGSETLRLGEAGPPSDDALDRLLELAAFELRRWGHAGHEVALERAVACFADPGRLRCSFWYETSHVAQIVLLPAGGGRLHGGRIDPPRAARASARSDGRWQRSVEPMRPAHQARGEPDLRGIARRASFTRQSRRLAYAACATGSAFVPPPVRGASA